MLKFKINSKKRGTAMRVKVSGTAKDLMVETAAVVHEVYKGIRAQNPEAAEGYKNRLTIALLDPNSPIWKENI